MTRRMGRFKVQMIPKHLGMGNIQRGFVIPLDNTYQDQTLDVEVDFTLKVVPAHMDQMHPYLRKLEKERSKKIEDKEKMEKGKPLKQTMVPSLFEAVLRSVYKANA